MMLTQTRLHQVAVLAEEGSFRRAATKLKISQPGLSKGIQALEPALGVPLFNREPGAVTLTEFGRRVLAHFREAAAAESDLVRDLALMRGLELGGIDVALGPYPSLISGYAAAAALVARHPGLAISLRVANWREVTRRVTQKQSDIGLAELSEAVLNEALETKLVGRYRVRLFCRPGHPILNRKRIALADLLQYPWVNTLVPARIAGAFPRSPVRAGRIDKTTGDFIPAIELDVPMQLGEFLKQGDALIFGTLGLMERELEAGTVAVTPASFLEARASYGFIYLKSRALSPGARAFMDAARDQEAIAAEREARLEKIYV